MKNHQMLYAPSDVGLAKPKGIDTRIFMAGSIDNGNSIDWHSDVFRRICDYDILAPIVMQFLNPRREIWDSSMSPTIDNAQFVEQVEWELSGIHSSDFILFYFQPGSVSPISLLECGLITSPEFRGRVIVCCPEGYWRRGNVEITCRYHGVPVVRTIDELVDQVVGKIIESFTGNIQKNIF